MTSPSASASKCDVPQSTYVRTCRGPTQCSHEDCAGSVRTCARACAHADQIGWAQTSWAIGVPRDGRLRLQFKTAFRKRVGLGIPHCSKECGVCTYVVAAVYRVRCTVAAAARAAHSRHSRGVLDDLSLRLGVDASGWTASETGVRQRMCVRYRARSPTQDVTLVAPGR
jgi:hypothetical protein